MNWRTTQEHWGWLTILIHWLTALTVFGLFGLGLWMRSLNYYHPWYEEGPHLHKSIGILLFILTILRLVLRRVEGKAAPLPNHTTTERTLAHLAMVLSTCCW